MSLLSHLIGERVGADGVLYAALCVRCKVGGVSASREQIYWKLNSKCSCAMSQIQYRLTGLPLSAILDRTERAMFQTIR